ncbi:response regulator transcription factor [Stackebrandtia nassauensis]|uniref:Two component transcriptional regulator, winged helix family n=1 Tax=Stackebrandtia nassauensis (strain DSM 44728 / CIP 108903 / NRRL B-16338 / NBRC 102104 / LLR-40K-21) TaxID=446470 RepID=D3Q8P1_STANL|nr:response regulator transcription factor [Stackebrandtia nassauensis]ADD44483.1 two component transcriptional regulator, winged helix family [Stackebrandtia nassauensis DSM 44728]
MRLLIVEDEQRMANALARGLKADGFAVEVAADGEAGLEAARFGSYDAIILDIMLPKLSGYEVIRTLRRENNWVPVLVLSAKDGEYDQSDGLDLGADDYLTKPFSYVVLLARLRALLRRGTPARPSVLTVGDLTLDPARHTVHREDTEISLSTREFSLLEYLMRNAEQVVTKVTLLDHVWSASEDTHVNLVEVYIGYLRKKIDTPFGRSSLQTVRGAGYRLTADRR